VATTTRSRKNALPFDFRRPSKFSRDHMRAFQVVHETFARQFSTVLATTLRATCHVSLTSVEQLTYDEYVRSLPNPSYMVNVALNPLPGSIVVQLPLPLAFAAVDRLLGGAGEAVSPKRTLSEIEASLMRGLMERGLRELEYAYETLVRVETEIVAHEHNPQFVQIAAPSDMALSISLEIRIGDKRGTASLCVPFTTMQPVLESLASESLLSDRSGRDLDVWAADLGDALNGTNLDVHLRFPEVALTGAEILGLRVGDVIPLHHDLDEPMLVVVDGLVTHRAVTGTRGRKLACLIVSNEGER
jgi:flagellar motor switch protein FliM